MGAEARLRRRRRVRWLVWAAVVLVVLLLVHRPVLAKVGQFLVESEPLEKANLIYVLAGDFYGSRVLVGAELGARGYAQQVLLSGGRYGDSYSGDLAVGFAVEHGYRRDLFRAVRLDASSTIKEARAMGPVFERMGVKSIILVTSNFHSRRTALVFRMFLPRFHFLVVPAPERGFDPGSWWKTPYGRQVVFSEYQKIIGTVLTGVGWRFGADRVSRVPDVAGPPAAALR